MASIVKVKNPNGTTYIYENTTIWNKETKKYNYKRTCIGKITPEGKEILYELKPLSIPTPKLSKSFGNIYFLDMVANAIGLRDVLKGIFTDDYETFITLVHYIICEDSSLSNSPKWLELNETILKTDLSSQYISTFLKQITEERRLEFFKAWVNKRLEQEYVAFDITSISSYSELINIVELGYNRDKENLPQINLGMFFGEESALPIFYNIYPGSIKDVKTLSNMLIYCNVLGISKIKFVMDKGFYSDTNITEMIEAKKRFTVAIPFKSAIATSKVKLLKETIKIPSKCIAIDELIYGDVIKDVWLYTDKAGVGKEASVYYHVMYDDDKRNEVENRIMTKVQRQKKEFDDYIAKYQRLPKDLEKYEHYLEIKKNRNKITCTIKDEVIMNEMKYEGFMVVISNDLKKPNEVFNTYRRKDVVEKAFDNLKNDLDIKRLKVHSEKALKGKMFIAFIALIIKTKIFNTTINDGSICKYSVNEIINEMRKISIIKFNEQTSMLTEISSTQRKIFKAFNIKEPTIESL